MRVKNPITKATLKALPGVKVYPLGFVRFSGRRCAADVAGAAVAVAVETTAMVACQAAGLAVLAGYNKASAAVRAWRDKRRARPNQGRAEREEGKGKAREAQAATA